MNWLPIAHRCELARPGDYVLAPWRADGEVALTNIGGDVIAFDNRCPHRGARIFTERSGNREPRCLYHGRLMAPGNARRYLLREFGGFLFVADGGEACWPMAMYDFLIGIPEGLTVASRLDFVMDCPWEVAVENALDYEHIPHVHADSLAKLALVPKALHCADGGSLHEFTSEAERLGRMARFFPKERRFDYIHAHFMPHACISSTRGWTYSLQQYWPRQDGRTNFMHTLYATPTSRPLPEFFASVARLNEQVFREDAVVCATVPDTCQGRLGPADVRVAAFREAPL